MESSYLNAMDFILLSIILQLWKEIVAKRTNSTEHMQEKSSSTY
jgi:hypothetical protein